MREQTYYIALDGYERGVIVNALNEMRNSLLQQGRYTDAVDEVLWGMLHKDYLEHNKSGLFMLMVTKCTLWPYLADIDRQANEMYDLLIEQMKKAEGVTEQLKEQDQLEWVQKMGNIQQQAREIVCSELIYSYN